MPESEWRVWQSYDFSPDGQWIAYILYRKKYAEGSCFQRQLWLVHRDGGRPRKVRLADDLNPSWIDWSHRTNHLALTANPCEQGLFEARARRRMTQSVVED